MKKHMKSVILGLSLVAISTEFNASAQCVGSWETSISTNKLIIK